MGLYARRLCLAASLALAGGAFAQPVEPVYSLAKKEKQPFLDTLRELVSIETGTRDLEGLEKAAYLIAGRLQALGGKVELIDPTPGAYRMADTPEKIGKVVRARFEGKGSKRILLLAHMDTVYLRGMLAKQPFRVEGGRAYGLGITDDKQGVALVLHTLAVLKAADFRGYGLVTVLINADEEMSSPGSRRLVTREGERHDAVFSCEASRADSDKLALATAGIASVVLRVKGRASHAGSAPEMGRNALYELAHQIMQTRDLSDPSTGLKMNWTLASAGTNRNVIPADAVATADVRVLRVADYDRIEREVRARIRDKLIPDTQVEMTFERRRPPLEANAAARSLGARAQEIYAEIGRKLTVDAVAEGGGTDAAFAALESHAATLERFGLKGFGAHSNDAEYVLLDSIEPRLYLLARMIMDVSR
ncbi:MAG TPA: M20/M25/M40 family metallo-hydrolase [Burkholderiales bacterium]|nr:M20/M25/M40 family metallo-hydrolase [Burkholderiales bacterium]